MADQELTLLEAAKQMEPSMRTGVVQLYADAYQPMRVAPVLSTDGKSEYDWTVEDSLPNSAGAAHKRNVNSDFEATQGTVDPYKAPVKIYGGKIKVDRYITHHSPASVGFQQASQVRAMSRAFSTDLFEGVGGTSLRGVRDWFKDPLYAGQEFAAGASANGDLLTTDMVDQLLTKVTIIPGQTFIYCRETLGRRIKKLSKGSVAGEYNINWTPEMFGMAPGSDAARDIYCGYDNVPVVIMRDAKNVNLLAATEVEGSGNASTCSLYVVTWGLEMATLISSMSELSPNGVPLPIVENVQSGTNFHYINLEWYAGFVPHTPRSIGRIKYLKDAVA